MKHSHTLPCASTGRFKEISFDKFYCTSDENHGALHDWWHNHPKTTAQSFANIAFIKYWEDKEMYTSSWEQTISAWCEPHNGVMLP
jgi:hypothetical protein